MRSSNFVTLRGRTTADIEVKVSPSDVHYCGFTLAVDRPVRKGQEKETDFFYVTAYQKTADFLGQYVTKGTLIAVAGELRNRKSEDKDGKKRSHIEILADCVEFAGPKASGSRQTAASKTVSPAASADVEQDDDLPF